MITNKIIAMNAIATARISRLDGFFLPSAAITVETIMVPPVTIGYWIDACRCISATTRK